MSSQLRSPSERACRHSAPVPCFLAASFAFPFPAGFRSHVKTGSDFVTSEMTGLLRKVPEMFNVSTLTSHPMAVLYALQALTYVTAAGLSLRHGHRDLSACYCLSALLHSVVAAYHFLGVE